MGLVKVIASPTTKKILKTFKVLNESEEGESFKRKYNIGGYNKDHRYNTMKKMSSVDEIYKAAFLDELNRIAKADG